MNYNVFKRVCLVLIGLLFTAFIFAQTHNDYMDDDAVAGGADRALNGLLILILLVIGGIILIFVGNALFNIYYWFNPKANPKYKETQKKKEIEEQRLKEEKQKIQRQTIILSEREREKRAIDLGLSVMWADSNMYEDVDSGKGAKFSWGDIEKRILSRIIDSKLINKNRFDLKKIIGNDDLSICGNEKYDAAKKMWGDNWRLPLYSEFDELINLCDWEWTAINGTPGYKVTGKNGNSVFLPVTGEFVNDKSYYPQAGFYWSGSANDDKVGVEAHFLYFNENHKTRNSNGHRNLGMAIRPVWSPNDEIVEKDGFTMSLYGTKLIKCKDVEDCHIPYGVKIVAKEAFKDAKKIRNLYIPNSVEEIEYMAFGFSLIESVYIPKSIVNWDGGNTFYGCECLKSVHIEEGLTKLGVHLFNGCKSLERINIPQSIIRLPDNIFSYCTSLKEIKLPSQLVEIGDSAFEGCMRLESIELPNSLIGLQPHTFSGCYSLSNLIIPEGVVAISSCCFVESFIDSEHKRIRIPSTIQYIDEDAFQDCFDLKLEVPQNSSINFEELNLDGDYEIIYYESSIPDNIEELKAKCDSFVKLQDFKSEQAEYEFRKEMGIITREEYEEEELWNMMDTIDEYE